jgi:hypothetical protein
MNENRPDHSAAAAAPTDAPCRPPRLFKPARLFALAALLLALGAASRPAHAQAAPEERTLNFSSVGVARGQAARLAVYWTRVSPPDPCWPPGPCRTYGPFQATLNFYDADGRSVARKEVTLYQNLAATLTYVPLDLAPGARAQLRGEVTIEPDPSGVQPCVIPAIEVINLDGSPSSVLNPGTLVGFNPQPDPPVPPDFDFGFVSAVSRQTFRVQASYLDADGLPPDPCCVTLSFYDESGRLVAQTVKTLELGKTVSFDVSVGELPTNSRRRLRASVHVEPLPGGIIPCIMPAVEIFNDDTGKTALFYPGAMIGE